MWVLYPGRIGIWSVGFCGGGKTREPREKNLHSKARTNNKLNLPTYGTGPESNPGHIGGRRALSPLRRPCFKISHPRQSSLEHPVFLNISILVKSEQFKSNAKTYMATSKK